MAKPLSGQPLGIFRAIHLFMYPEELLPKHVLEKAIKSGKEYAWRQQGVQQAIIAAKEIGLATIGGQVQFITPDGVCELYWLSYDSTARKGLEKWEEFVIRSANESIGKFNELCIKTNFINAGIESFLLLREMSKSEDISKYLYFVLYFEKQPQ
jgi:hypothetical protein